MSDATIYTNSDDASLLQWLLERCHRNLASDENARQYLRDDGVSDEKVWKAYRIGVWDDKILADLDDAGREQMKSLGLWSIPNDGILLPTFDPAAPDKPVGFIRCWAARNNHKFVTAPTGLILPSDIADRQRVIITDIPMLALRLAQAGAMGVVCAEDMTVLPLYKEWLTGRELVITSCRVNGLEELKSAVAALGLSAQAVIVHSELARTSPQALALLGLDKSALNPPVEVPITPLLLRDLYEFATARLQDGNGRYALREQDADDPEFVAAYGLGFLPSGFREALDEGARPALNRHRIENSIIVPAFNDAGAVADLLAVHMPGLHRTHINLSAKPAGMIAPKIAAANDEIVAVDAFRLAASLFKSGKRNVMLFRGIDDLKANIERLWASGVRNADVMFRRDPKDAVAAFEAAGIVAEDCGIPRSHGDAPRLSEKLEVKAPKRLVLLPDVQPNPEEAAPTTVAKDSAAVQTAVATVTLELVKHDQRLQQATFKVGDVLYITEVPFDSSAKLAVEIRQGAKFHRDRFDLNSEAQRKRFATSGALRTGVAFEQISEHLLHLLDAVRGLQQELVNPAKSMTPAVALTDAERAEANAYLKRADLLDAFTADMAALGWAGEDKLKRSLALMLVSRLLEKPISVALRAPSSSGKSHAIETIALLAPPEDVVHVSSLSGSALHYQSDLRHKLLVIDEADAMTSEVVVALRVLQSRGALTHSSTGRDTASGKTVAKFTEAQGPVAVLTSSTSEMDMEFISRCYDLSTDTSPEQTERILEAQRRLLADPAMLGADGKRMKIVNLHRNIQRLLRGGAGNVQIPFANRIQFPTASVKHRREQERFLGLIQASALLHQHQRLKNRNDAGREYVVADLRDYQIAVDLAAHSVGRASDELSTHARDVLSLIQSSKRAAFTINELWALNPAWTHHKLRTGLEELAAMDVIASPKRTRPRRYELQASAAAILAAPHVRLLPAAALTSEGIRGSGTFGEIGIPVISPTAATG